MILTRTPFRLSLCGGGSDLPGFWRKHGGAVCSLAVRQYCYVSARFLPPYHDFRTRVVYSRTEEVSSNDRVAHPLVRGALGMLGVSEGVEIFHQGDLPGRSGLGSSSSFAVGLLSALLGLLHRRLPPLELALMASRLEQDVVGEAVGNQDQVAAACGGLNHVQFLPSGDVKVEPLPLDDARREELCSHLLLLLGSRPGTASDATRSYAGKIDALEQHEQRALAGQAADAVVRGDLRALAGLVNRGWRLKASLSKEAFGPHSCVVAEGVAHGAWGGKLVGAGNGGSYLFVCPPDKHETVADAVGLRAVPVHIDTQGSAVVYHG